MALKIKDGIEYRDGRGLKAGPFRRRVEGFWEWDGHHYNDNGVCCLFGKIGDCHVPKRDLISEWNEGPIRTVTRREPVSGKYSNGDVDVSVHPDGLIQISVSMLTLKGDRVRSACMVLSQLAEFLDEDKGDE